MPGEITSCLKNYDSQSFVDLKLEGVESQLSKVQSTNIELSKTIERVESRLHDFKKSLETMFKDQLSDNIEPTPKLAPISEDSAAQIAYSFVFEQKEKEKCQLNIILHNLEESSSSDGLTRKQDDIKRCKSVFKTYLGALVTITNAFRLGQNSTKA